jgi:preprotein translocase subunit SecA
LSDELVKIGNDSSLSEVEKMKAKEEMHARHQDRSERIHVISQLLRAYSLYEKDVEYMVQEDRIIIVDEHTGRPLEGRRYSDGLHQAIEAKEKVKVQRESQTLASITLQNYFRMYEKLAGMTGTAETEENELWEIYKLEVVVIPTNDKIRRHDYDDVVYKTRKEKYKALLAEIKKLNEVGRPVLVGTISVEISEFLAGMLKRQGVKCQVLNARHHQHEADIVSQAGQFGAVTIATNMAGRGTDIKLGAGVVTFTKGEGNRDGAEGGLFVLGTERHESRRIDRQLRGRSGRQGDPGATRFYLSLEDDLMRLFGSDRIARIMDRLGMKEDEPIIHPWITKSVERAQKRVEGRNFEIRKHLLEYDNVMNIMRVEIYKRRKAALTGEKVDDVLKEMVENYLEDALVQFCGEDTPTSEWDWEGLKAELLSVLSLSVEERNDLSIEDLLDLLTGKAFLQLEERKKFVDSIDPELFDRVKRVHILRTIDDLWKDHLYDMDCLREGINYQSYGQKDPLIEYKKQGFDMFEKMLTKLQKQAVEKVFNTTFTVEEKRGNQSLVNVRFSKAEVAPALSQHTSQQQNIAPEGPPPRHQQGPQRPITVAPKVSPNDPCPCGSGKKFKKCHG